MLWPVSPSFVRPRPLARALGVHSRQPNYMNIKQTLKYLILFFLMYFYAMSSVLADMCGNSIYYNKHPEECWSKEDIRNYKERQKKSAHDAQIEQRNLNKIAPPATLIESVVKQCIINKIYDQEIYDSSLKVESSIGLPKTLAEKLNGIEYYGYITYSYTYRDLRPKYADGWKEGGAEINYTKTNGIISFDDDALKYRNLKYNGIADTKCNTTINMTESNPILICASDCLEKQNPGIINYIKCKEQVIFNYGYYWEKYSSGVHREFDRPDPNKYYFHSNEEWCKGFVNNETNETSVHQSANHRPSAGTSFEDMRKKALERKRQRDSSQSLFPW